MENDDVAQISIVVLLLIIIRIILVGLVNEEEMQSGCECEYSKDPNEDSPDLWFYTETCKQQENIHS